MIRRKITETKPDGKSLADLERDAANGGMPPEPPLAPPTFSRAELRNLDDIADGVEDTPASSINSDALKPIANLLAKHGKALSVLVGQDAVDELAELAALSDDSGQVQESVFPRNNPEKFAALLR